MATDVVGGQMSALDKYLHLGAKVLNQEEIDEIYKVYPDTYSKVLDKELRQVYAAEFKALEEMGVGADTITAQKVQEWFKFKVNQNNSNLTECYNDERELLDCVKHSKMLSAINDARIITESYDGKKMTQQEQGFIARMCSALGRELKIRTNRMNLLSQINFVKSHMDEEVFDTLLKKDAFYTNNKKKDTINTQIREMFDRAVTREAHIEVIETVGAEEDIVSALINRYNQLIGKGTSPAVAVDEMRRELVYSIRQSKYQSLKSETAVSTEAKKLSTNVKAIESVMFKTIKAYPSLYGKFGYNKDEKFMPLELKDKQKSELGAILMKTPNAIDQITSFYGADKVYNMDELCELIRLNPSKYAQVLNMAIDYVAGYALSADEKKNNLDLLRKAHQEGLKEDFGIAKNNMIEVRDVMNGVVGVTAEEKDAFQNRCLSLIVDKKQRCEEYNDDFDASARKVENQGIANYIVSIQTRSQGSDDPVQ